MFDDAEVLYFPAGDAPRARRARIAVARRDPAAMRARAGARAPARILEQYAGERVAERYADLYERVLADRRLPAQLDRARPFTEAVKATRAAPRTSAREPCQFRSTGAANGCGGGGGATGRIGTSRSDVFHALFVVPNGGSADAIQSDRP